MFKSPKRSATKALIGASLSLMALTSVFHAALGPHARVPARGTRLDSPPKAFAQSPSPAHHWLASPDNIGATEIEDIGSHPTQLDGLLVGDPTLAVIPDGWALGLDGRTQSVQMGQIERGAALPVQEMTVEAWVSIFSTIPFGGIVSVVQDDLEAETGWVLGYDSDAFTFALSSVGADDGDGELSYIGGGGDPLELRRFYHVVGTYDGREMRLYVDGRIRAATEAQSGPIVYPERTFFDLGAYHDTDENERMHGQLAEAAVYDRVLDAEEVMARYRARPLLVDSIVPTPTSLPSLEPAPSATPNANDANRLLIIGIDGVRPDALTESDTPNLDRLMSEGAFSLRAQTGDITHSGPGWSSLLTGVWRDKHGVNSNGFANPNFEAFPHFFKRLKAFRNTARTASIVHWAPINQRIVPAEDTDVRANHFSADAVAADAVSHLRSDAELSALFIHFDDADSAGHSLGFDPPYTPGNPYREAIEREDARVGQLMDALAARPKRDEERWLILVATDHGGTGRAHGQDIPEHRTIFYIAAGDAALQGEIEPAPEIVDVAVTALTHLGVPIRPEWQLDGRSVGLADPPPAQDTPTPGPTHTPGPTATPRPPTPAPTPPFHGTIFIDPDILTEDDPTSFEGATYAGRGTRTVYDRRPADWVTIEAYLFDLRFDDGLESEAIVNPEFGSEEAAEVLALQYAEEVGRLPTALRRDMDALWIHAGTELFGGGNRSILIHTGQSDAYIRDGILEETLIHEAAHTSLDADHARAEGWLEAQGLDGNFISAYARDNPLREDVAETFVPYLAERYRRDRISEELAETILETIPNRMDYLDAQDFDLYPMVRHENGGLIWLPVLHLGGGQP